MFQDVSRDELMTQKTKEELADVVMILKRERELLTKIDNLREIVEAKNKIIAEQEKAINELQVELDTVNTEEDEDEDDEDDGEEFEKPTLYQLGVALNRMAMEIIDADGFSGIRNFKRLVQFFENPEESEKRGYCYSGSAACLKDDPCDWLKEDAHELMAKYPNLLYSIDLLQNVGSNLKDQEGNYDDEITEEDIEMVKSYLKDNTIWEREGIAKAFETLQEVRKLHEEKVLNAEEEDDEDDDDEYAGDYDDDEDDDEDEEEEEEMDSNNNVQEGGQGDEDDDDDDDENKAFNDNNNDMIIKLY